MNNYRTSNIKVSIKEIDVFTKGGKIYRRTISWVGSSLKEDEELKKLDNLKISQYKKNQQVEELMKRSSKQFTIKEAEAFVGVEEYRKALDWMSTKYELYFTNTQELDDIMKELESLSAKNNKTKNFTFEELKKGSPVITFNNGELVESFGSFTKVLLGDKICYLFGTTPLKLHSHEHDPLFDLGVGETSSLKDFIGRVFNGIEIKNINDNNTRNIFFENIKNNNIDSIVDMIKNDSDEFFLMLKELSSGTIKEFIKKLPSNITHNDKLMFEKGYSG